MNKFKGKKKRERESRERVEVSWGVVASGFRSNHRPTPPTDVPLGEAKWPTRALASLLYHRAALLNLIVKWTSVTGETPPLLSGEIS